MFIDPNWRILTIGDGDLSFSQSIWQHYKPKFLTATVLDSKSQLVLKYGSQHLDNLELEGVPVLFEFDVTKLNSWQNLKAEFDLVIFQFPLIPGFVSKESFHQQKIQHGVDISINTLNRRLLHLFLKHSFEFFLLSEGARLAYISSKDVKPYIEWNIEDQIHQQLPINYCGSSPFDIDRFSGYKIRNVDRDKHVKETNAFTYVWSDNPNSELPLTPFVSVGEQGCEICRAGPFTTMQERHSHHGSKKHKRMSDYHRQWLSYLNQRG